jgi:hypothetical protein
VRLDCINVTDVAAKQVLFLSLVLHDVDRRARVAVRVRYRTVRVLCGMWRRCVKRSRLDSPHAMCLGCIVARHRRRERSRAYLKRIADYDDDDTLLPIPPVLRPDR